MAVRDHWVGLRNAEHLRESSREVRQAHFIGQGSREHCREVRQIHATQGEVAGEGLTGVRASEGGANIRKGVCGELLAGSLGGPASGDLVLYRISVTWKRTPLSHGHYNGKLLGVNWLSRCLAPQLAAFSFSYRHAN